MAQLVARCVRDAEAVSSSLTTPTRKNAETIEFNRFRRFLFFAFRKYFIRFICFRSVSIHKRADINQH